MPGGRGHRFEFVGNPPLVVWVLAVLFFANTSIGLSLASLGTDSPRHPGEAAQVSKLLPLMIPFTGKPVLRELY
jgi:hypothetical protein